MIHAEKHYPFELEGSRTHLPLLRIGLIMAFCAILCGGVLSCSPAEKESSDQIDEQKTEEPAKPAEESEEEKLAKERTAFRDAAIISEGTYQVGVDLDAGQYYVNGLDPFEGFSTLIIAADASGSDAGTIGKDSFKGNSIADLVNGQFVTISNAEMYPIELYDDELKESIADGFYRVGIDIPAGDYLIEPGTVGQGTFEVCSDASHTASSIIASGSFQEGFTQTLGNGQYLKISEATAELA